MTQEEGKKLRAIALERNLTLQALMREAIAPYLGDETAGTEKSSIRPLRPSR
jgi:hypothetical protein